MVKIIDEWMALKKYPRQGVPGYKSSMRRRPEKDTGSVPFRGLSERLSAFALSVFRVPDYLILNKAVIGGGCCLGCPLVAVIESTCMEVESEWRI